MSIVWMTSSENLRFWNRNIGKISRVWGKSCWEGKEKQLKRGYITALTMEFSGRLLIILVYVQDDIGISVSHVVRPIGVQCLAQ